MPSSIATAKLSAALARAQAKYTKLEKDKTGREGNLSFKYVQLPDVLAMVRPLLNAEGVYLSQPLVKGEDGFLRQTTKVQLEDEWEQSDGVPIQAMTPGKEMGKTITYARRIDLMPFLGISGEDEDEDAPDLKSSPSPSKPSFGKPINTVAQVEKQTKPKSTDFSYGSNIAVSGGSRPNPEITDDDLPDFGEPDVAQVNEPLDPEAAAVADHLSNFVPLTKERNDQIQNRLKDLVSSKVLDRRKLGLFLDAQHGGKKQFDVHANQWEQTIAKIEAAVSLSSEDNGAAVKALLKPAKVE
jgi:hypothetical protein